MSSEATAPCRLRCPCQEEASRSASSFHNKEPKMARTLTLSALYIVALGTMFGAYALTI